MALFLSGAVTSKSASNQTAASTRSEGLSSGELLTIRGEFPPRAAGDWQTVCDTAGSGRLEPAGDYQAGADLAGRKRRQGTVF